MKELNRRRGETNKRIAQLREKLSATEEMLLGKACVYATGSFGRQEASEHSDLDLLIVGKSSSETKERLLRPLDEICVKADLIDATRALNIPDFDGGGRYLVHYSARDLCAAIGAPEDDAANTFTSRLLLLLESHPLLEKNVYDEVVSEVIAAYWRDYKDHKTDFVPGYLVNDILRLWRTFCVNYEARTKREPDEKKIEGKIKNYKLKYSRMLTCFSALLYLLAIFKKENTVSPTNAIEMVALSPTKRIEYLLQQPELSNSHKTLDSIISNYDHFLERTNMGEAELSERLRDKELLNQYMKEATDFGNRIFDALRCIGDDNALHRLIVV